MGEGVEDGVKAADLDRFIDRWKKSGGAETSNTHSFLNELCDLLGLPKPDPAQENNALNDYVYERKVVRHHSDDSTSTRSIDLYKRGCFVLESKQGSDGKAKKADAAQVEMFGAEAGQHKAGTAKRGTQGWVTAMRAAREQAERYAKDLPPEHGWPPFLIVCDVGYCLELFADFSGQGKNYAQFPDRRSFRVLLDDLRNPSVRDRLRRVWTDPPLLDPARESAEATREIALRLAVVARRLEKTHDAETVATFLMRCLFTMFAEDVELLKKDSFTHMLERLQATPERAHIALQKLWEEMNTGTELSGWLEESVRRFNGGLFKDATALPLDAEMLAELTIAARKNWRNVEPAIFGTLLEQALDKKERSKLGAHYTPRSYVERLVTPTIIEPLRADWRDVQAECESLLRAGKKDDALRAARRFHAKLCETRVLDPACGTGNFLYVAMEMMKRLEGDVVDYIVELGGEATLEFQGHTVDPHQFLGLEINQRAVAIAELVLWIGFIKWQLKTGGQDIVRDPVLRDFHNIRHQDAVLAHGKPVLRKDEEGKPVTRWDGETFKKHPVTGEDVPDETARKEIYDYPNPRPAEWPEAKFIVGNPPFIGKGGLRSELGDGYAEALWKAHPEMPHSADFVMYWWNHAAELLRAGAGKKNVAARNPRRFGFITTNSIRQTFNRRVLERHMAGKNSLSLAYAIPDHPWLKSADKAAVRIAMTVAEAGKEEIGILAEIASESCLNSDQPMVELKKAEGVVGPSLRLGPRIVSATALAGNENLSANGFALHGAGFQLSPAEAETFMRDQPKIGMFLQRYVKGGDLTSRLTERFVFDFEAIEEAVLRSEFPRAFQYLAEKVKPERDQNNDKARKRLWWKFGRRHSTVRSAINGLDRIIATTETSKHRHFQFLQMPVRPDHMVVCVALSDGAWLAVLSSYVHTTWALAAGGTLEDRPRYNKTRCFDPFPFPDLTDKAGLKAHLDELGERLDAFRKGRLAAHKQLTMTKLYNVLEALREGRPLTDPEKDIYEAGQVGILKSIHDDIDAAVFEAYGWPADLEEEEILERLVALNHERAAEEAQGHVRWLRPDFQAPKEAKPKPQAQAGFELPEAAKAAVAAAAFPKSPAEQARLLREVLDKAGKPLKPDEIARLFGGKNTKAKVGKVEEMLGVLSALGQAEADDQGRYFSGA